MTVSINESLLSALQDAEPLLRALSALIAAGRIDGEFFMNAGETAQKVVLAVAAAEGRDFIFDSEGNKVLIADMPEVEASDDEYDDGSYPPRCSNPEGHEWAENGEAGGTYCLYCGANGDI